MTRKSWCLVILAVLAITFVSVEIAEARRGCCSHHDGVCGCQCCDGTPLSAKCAPYYPSCNEPKATPEPTPKPTPVPTPEATPEPTPKASELDNVIPLMMTGKVVAVADGDTITVLNGTTPVKIRLDAVDCPESHQAYGTRAKQFTSDLVFGKQVSVKPLKTDRYGRTVGIVLLPDGRNLNHELVKNGFAWWYRKYAPHDTTLAQLERDARTSGRGLWADPNPVAPWEFRRNRKAAERSTPAIAENF